MTLKPVLNPMTGKFDFVQILTGYVPYTGATNDVDLGAHDLAVSQVTIKSGNKLILDG